MSKDEKIKSEIKGFELNNKVKLLHWDNEMKFIVIVSIALFFAIIILILAVLNMGG